MEINLWPRALTLTWKWCTRNAGSVRLRNVVNMPSKFQKYISTGLRDMEQTRFRYGLKEGRSDSECEHSYTHRQGFMTNSTGDSIVIFKPWGVKQCFVCKAHSLLNNIQASFLTQQRGCTNGWILIYHFNKIMFIPNVNRVEILHTITMLSIPTCWNDLFR